MTSTDAPSIGKLLVFTFQFDGIGLYSYSDGVHQRDASRLQVLKPVEIKIDGEMTVDGRQKVDIVIGHIYLQLNPTLVRTLSALASNLGIEPPDDDQPDQQSIEAANKKKSPTLKKRSKYWCARKLHERDYWWFQAVSKEAKRNFSPHIEVIKCVEEQRQQLNVIMSSFMFTLEAGTSERTIPLILFEASISANVYDWSTLMTAAASVNMRMAYYNENYRAWEPIIEPIEESAQDGRWRSWQLKVQMATHSEDEQTDDSESAPPRMTISLYATDVMQITVTKTLLDVANKLNDSFQMAAKRITLSKSTILPGTAPYLLLNQTGVPINAFNSETLKINSDNNQSIDAIPNEYVYLNFDGNIAEQQPSSESISFLETYSSGGIVHTKIKLNIRTMKTVRELDVTRAGLRIYSLPPLQMPSTHHSDAPCQIVSHVRTEFGRKLITLRSTIQMVNHLNVPIEVYSLIDKNLELCGRMGAADEDDGSSTLHIPMAMIYPPAVGDFYFQPDSDHYEVSAESISWRNFDKNKQSFVRCASSTDNYRGFYIQVYAEIEHCLHENTNSNSQLSAYIVHLWPSITVHNLLPIPIQLTIIAKKTTDSKERLKKCAEESLPLLDGGESMALNNVYPGIQQIGIKLNYPDAYQAELILESDAPPLSIIKLNNESGTTLNLGMHTTIEQGRLNVHLYAPFWMINNTAHTLTYQESSAAPMLGVTSCSPCSHRKRTQEAETDEITNYEARHGPDESNPLLLWFNDKDFLSKKKAKVRINNSEWSDEFPLDTVGSAGRVCCKTLEGHEMDIAVHIQLCSSGLTKMVKFSPFYLINNRSRFAIEIREDTQTEWIVVNAQSCIGFWPIQKSNRKLLTARYANTKDNCPLFPFTEVFSEFARVNNEHIGMYIACTIGESSAVITFEDFIDGMAPVLIINHTNLPFYCRQKSADKDTELEVSARHQCYYAWSDLSTDRTLVWRCGHFHAEDGLYKEGHGEFTPEKQVQTLCSKSTPSQFLYWISFLNGQQRVLMITGDVALAPVAQRAYEVERIAQQVTVTLQGIGLSLVNNVIGMEVAYMAITSSGVVWEQLIRSRYRPFTAREIQNLESAYTKWQPDKRNETITVDKLRVDFTTMKLVPSGVSVRRSFQPGLWIRYSSSEHQIRVHMKVNHMQIDNQLPACVFNVVFAPVPPPKSVAADNAPKPFTELSLAMRKSERDNVAQIKYFRVLIQEMAVKVDKGFINAMLELFPNEAVKPTSYTSDMLAKDLDTARSDLSSLAITSGSTAQKAFYDNLHISPLMLHLSFSMGGSSGQSEESHSIEIQSEFINLLLKSVGVTVTELQDVVFKLAYFQREFVFYDQQQLQNEIISHYTNQAVKQMYVLVLGLDIMGNPFGLVRDLSSGVEDLFYEPFRGAVQGPGEFAEGLALGVRSLFGHTVGGAAGAVSRITGTLGKGVAALTLDDEYQRKRQEALNRRPKNFGQGMVSGGRGLIEGVFDAATGVFLKPIEGAREGGVGGFALGVGKGLVGVVTRPVSGVVDFASSSLNAVRSITTTTVEAKQMRPPRYISADKIIRAYVASEAYGSKLLREMNKGEFATTDNYIAHAPISNKRVFIVTNKRLLFTSKHDLFGSWNVDWQFEYSELRGQPERIERGIKIELRERRKGFLGIIGGTSGKLVQFVDSHIGNWIADKAIAAYEATQ